MKVATVSSTSPELVSSLAGVSQRLETASPGEIISWALSQFTRPAFACSFEDLALLNMLREAQPNIPVIFLDTQGHFPETLSFLDEMTTRWSLNVVRTTPTADADAWPCGTGECCQRRKVEPLGRALAAYDVWFTAVKRVDAETRRAMPIVSWDENFGLVKVNPLALWSDDDVSYYLRSHEIPEHPLWADGYASIGCAQVTVRPAAGADRRSGRWVGSDKEECGLHEG